MANEVWQRRAGIVSTALRMTAHDVATGARESWVNGIGGARLMPRPVRSYIYRSVGIAADTWDICSRCTIVGKAPLSIGALTYINHECYFELCASITIGANCAIGMQSMFITSAHPFDANGHFTSPATGMPITVGDDCWIGARATILPGVNIGHDVAVAAGSIVTKDCEPGGLYAGVPARRIRDLSAA